MRTKAKYVTIWEVSTFSPEYSFNIELSDQHLGTEFNLKQFDEGTSSERNAQRNYTGP